MHSDKICFSFLDLKIAHMELVELFISKHKDKDVIRYIHEKFSDRQVNEKELRKKVGLFSTKFSSLWVRSNRPTNRFMKNNAVWLRGSMVVSCVLVENIRKGRPTKPFVESCRKTKMRKIHAITEAVPKEELLYAAAATTISSGHRAAGQMIALISGSPEQAVQIRRSNHNEDNVEKYSAVEALSFICKNDFSKSQYLNIRSVVQLKGLRLYPSYHKILEAKALCYPQGKLCHYKFKSEKGDTLFTL